MSNKTRLLFIILVCGFFLSLDRVFKYLSLRGWAESQLVSRFFGWQPSLNGGIAFSLPVPVLISITLTIPIIILLLYILYKNFQKFPTNFALLLILCGASSNLLDRIIYNHTIDYFLLFTAIINIADIMITVGFVIYLLNRKKQTP